MNKIYLNLFIFLFPFLSISQTKWFFENKNYFDFVLETKVEGNKFIAHTRKDVFQDYFSFFELIILKKKLKIQQNEFIYIEATKTSDLNEFKGTFYEIKNSNKVLVKLDEENLILKIINASDTVKLIGKKVEQNFHQDNYYQLYKEIFSKLDTNIFDERYLNSKSFKKAKNELTKNSSKMIDNYEFNLGFYISTRIKRKLDFTHFYLVKKTDNIISNSTISLREITPNTCILDIDGFQGDRLKIDSLLDKIQVKKYQNLIIDLRDNGGGSFETASPLGNFISAKPIITGLFPNRHWYDKSKSVPTLADTNEFTSFNNGTLEQFYEIANSKSGVYIKTIPNDKPFKGNLYLLVNNRTGSTAEVVTMAFKDYKLGTIVGSKTSGALLSMKWFEINNLFEIGIPTNDFISVSGYRVDKKGIEPDINTGSKDALTYILEKIKN